MKELGVLALVTGTKTKIVPISKPDDVPAGKAQLKEDHEIGISIVHCREPTVDWAVGGRLFMMLTHPVRRQPFTLVIRDAWISPARRALRGMYGPSLLYGT